MAVMKCEWYTTMIFYAYLYACVYIWQVCATCVCMYPMRLEEGTGSPQAGIAGVLQMELLSFARALHAFNPGIISPVTGIIPPSTFFPTKSYPNANKEVIMVCNFDTDK